MEQVNIGKRWDTLTISAAEFQERIDKIASQNTDRNDPDKKASVYSRLALIHQVAKAYAIAEAKRNGVANPIIDIDEITDPPLSDNTDDEPVIIRFSYTH